MLRARSVEATQKKLAKVKPEGLSMKGSPNCGEENMKIERRFVYLIIFAKCKLNKTVSVVWKS